MAEPYGTKEKLGYWAIEPDFLPTESLFIRVEESRHICGGVVLGEAIKLPCQSCNRERYSTPFDIIRVHPGWRAAAITVDAIPGRPALRVIEDIEREMGKPYPHTIEFSVIHDPIPDNRAHTEIRMSKDGIYDPRAKPSALIKKWFRETLASSLQLIA